MSDEIQLSGADPVPGADALPAGDALPEDLDLSNFVGPYQFPNVKRRRGPGLMYLGAGTVLFALYGFTRESTPILINSGTLWAAISLALIGIHHLATAWDFTVTETAALVEASKATGFAIGHASAQLSGRGFRSRPTWRVLCYSADEPPTKRGFVLIDGVDGHLVDHLVEANPEDWSEYDAKPKANS